MDIKPRVINSFKGGASFLRDGVQLEYTVGNVVLDGSKFSQDTLVKAGTALTKNTDSGLYELVGEETTEINAGVLTANDVVVQANESESVSALRKASVFEELTTGVTDAFKEATKGRITFDI